MRILAVTSLMLVTVLSTGCVFFRDGSYQAVTVTTTPTNAICKFSYDNETAFSTVVSGEPAYNIRRSYKDIYITCSKKGYHDGEAILSSELERDRNRYLIWSAGLDILSETNKSYPEEVHVNLTKI